jgi:hypothetical protein
MADPDIQGELLELSRALRPIGKPFVSLVDVASELGAVVSLQMCTDLDSPGAQIDLRSRPPKVILYRLGRVNGERELRSWEENLLSARERFSIAHELGHWILFSRFRIGPQTDNRTYWDHERAINEFAGHLLAPDWLVEHWLESTPKGMPVPPFALRYWAVSLCRSSEDVIAKRLVQHRSSIGFLRLLLSRRSKDGAEVLQVMCSAAGGALRLPNERSHLDAPELRQLLKAEKVGSASLSELKLGRCKAQSLQIAWRRGKPLKSAETIWVSLSAEARDGMAVGSSAEQLAFG